LIGHECGVCWSAIGGCSQQFGLITLAPQIVRYGFRTTESSRHEAPGGGRRLRPMHDATNQGSRLQGTGAKYGDGLHPDRCWPACAYHWRYFLAEWPCRSRLLHDVRRVHQTGSANKSMHLHMATGRSTRPPKHPSPPLLNPSAHGAPCAMKAP
jgi:hypothetical protein